MNLHSNEIKAHEQSTMDEKDKYVEKDTETESMNSSPTPISVSSLVEPTNNKYKNDETNNKKKVSDAKVNTRGSNIIIKN